MKILAAYRKDENELADAKAQIAHPHELTERIAAFLFNCDYLAEWGDIACFWYEENSESYRDRARRIVKMIRDADPEALEALN